MACSTGGDGDFVTVRETQNGGNGFDGAGPGDGIGLLGSEPFVTGILAEHSRLQSHFTDRQKVAELAKEF
jgi:hypothetical protein